MNSLKELVANFRKNFKKNFLRWTPAFALLYAVAAIIGLSVANAMVRHDWVYLAIGAGALVLLAFGLWPVRRVIPHILGLEAEFPSLHKNNETRRT